MKVDGLAEFYNMDYALVMSKLKPIFEMAKNERKLVKVELTEESFVDTLIYLLYE